MGEAKPITINQEQYNFKADARDPAGFRITTTKWLEMLYNLLVQIATSLKTTAEINGDIHHQMLIQNEKINRLIEKIDGLHESTTVEKMTLLAGDFVGDIADDGKRNHSNRKGK